MLNSTARCEASITKTARKAKQPGLAKTHPAPALTDHDLSIVRNARIQAAERAAFPELGELDDARSFIEATALALCGLASAVSCVDEVRGTDGKDDVARELAVRCTALAATTLAFVQTGTAGGDPVV